jgi:chemotaxis protein methyltransferase WspC
MQRIEKRLRDVMGLDAETIGSSSLQRTIRLRMKAAGVADVDAYYHLVTTSAAEWNQLVEAVVVTETWFFRDRQAFGTLTNMVLQDWLLKHATGRVRILSLPCSSGEEPYSIAMALLDAGIAPARFAIEAVDLSQRVLEKALAGVYGRNSFRGRDLAFRDRHFSPVPETEFFVVRQTLRESITFRQANVLGEDFPQPSSAFDFIFCRNLLIYFDRATQQQAFKRLDALLAPGGTLFVGPAEIPLAMENGFSGLNLAMAFACRRTRELKVSRTPPPPVRPARPTKPRLSSPTKPLVPSQRHSRAPAQPPVPPKATVVQLENARELADSGKLEEAVTLCRAHLDQQGASVDAYYLLGVIRDAQGDPSAREFYRKALYLDPQHYETLLQMALLAEREGDLATARNLRRRAQQREAVRSETQ